MYFALGKLSLNYEDVTSVDGENFFFARRHKGDIHLLLFFFLFHDLMERSVHFFS